jgi:hypothetical protein
MLTPRKLRKLLDRNIQKTHGESLVATVSYPELRKEGFEIYQIGITETMKLPVPRYFKKT